MESITKTSFKQKKKNLFPLIQKKNLSLLWDVGRLVPQKSIDNLLKAMHKLNDKNVKLFIVGKGPLKKDLKNLSKKLKIEDQVFGLILLMIL